MPSVSVIIPTYNRKKTIRYCLDSVLDQTLPPLEVVVVDDCSTDGTPDVVREYGDSRVRCVVLERNSGAQAARNRGIREARGEWIAFQDSDDEWTPDKLEKQVEALRAVDFDPMTVVHTDAWRYDPAAGTREIWHLPVVDGACVYPRLLQAPGPLFPTILTSRAALERVELLDEQLPSYQEWDTVIRLARCCRFVHLRDALFIYHLHQDETISKSPIRAIQGYQYIVDKFRDEILRHCGKEALNSHLVTNAVQAMRHGFFREAEKILAKTVGPSVNRSILRRLARAGTCPDFFLSFSRMLQSAKTAGAKLFEKARRSHG